MMEEFKWGWGLLAGAGTLGIFWRQIASIFKYVRSIVIVERSLEPGAVLPFMLYLWRHARRGALGIKRYTVKDAYIRPVGRWAYYAMEIPGDQIVFWINKRPLYLSSNDKKKEGSSSNGDESARSLTVTYIRLFFDFEKLLNTSVREYNDLLKDNKSNRYSIIRRFGASGNKDDSKSEVSFQGGSGSAGKYDGTRPLEYTYEEIGAPIEDYPFDNLIYDESIYDFRNLIHQWKESKAWYRKRGLIWRFGALLKGPPGTGKTSFVRALGQQLDFPIQLFDLATMSNDELVSHWNQGRSWSPTIYLLEDIDRLFFQGKFRPSKSINKNPLTLDCVLNAISGVEPLDGVILLATANHVDNLDPALLRAGRFDVQIEFKYPSSKIRKQIAESILGEEYPDMVPKIVALGDQEDDSQANFVHRCSEAAIRQKLKLL